MKSSIFSTISFDLEYDYSRELLKNTFSNYRDYVLVSVEELHHKNDVKMLFKHGENCLFIYYKITPDVVNDYNNECFRMKLPELFLYLCRNKHKKFDIGIPNTKYKVLL